MCATKCSAKTKVRVVNKLEDRQDLHLHCKSKDDDLGTQVVTPDGIWTFSFDPNFWGTTQFFCRFWWNGDSHWFHIYRASRHDPPLCPDENIIWEVKKTGPCFITCFKKKPELCDPWKS
ncbi:hypothetical protein Tsubulata_041774 [Turnera subulata]|uniref:S-protein homolog n=1 Tax=Turnera subulata TaxID=218843 RepID=A0A9Q0FNR7_9ROSI|nr:hypothetical protein Tsubulata_041774 [Turnera subulata]